MYVLYMLSNLQKTELQQLDHDCYEQKDMNMKIEILYKINSMLPESLRLKKIPSLLTDDYIDNLLYKIEQNLLLQSNNMVEYLSANPWDFYYLHRDN
jgi:hypothetical protein